jgi:hypothetical protein
VFLHVLGHIDPNQVGLVVEERRGKGSRQLGFSDSSRTKKEKGTNGPIRVFDAGARTEDRICDGLHRFILADHSLMEQLAQL